MFARIFRVALKPGQGEGYAQAIEGGVIPIIREFPGFLDEMAMVSIDGKEAIAISFWERKEDADAYERAAYSKVRSMIEPFMAGPPELHQYDVTTSTVHARAGAFQVAGRG